MPRRAPMHARRQGGFTLMEMMIVLVVLGLALGIVMSHGPLRSPRLEARAAASEIAQGLRAARVAAIIADQPVVFIVDAARHSFHYGGMKPRALPPALALSVTTVTGATDRKRQLAGITFEPDGSSTGGRIVLADGTLRLQVGVDWLTGRVAVAEAQ